ncbi:cytochrome-c peroxidase [Rubinisphaera sp.]|uniref:cytochrome-c peroxidase n=1 Tax=Rubinisphaera sp. TaxID=2024857 RepID=UPI0025F1B50A|nr:cytochrome-c peroxidase [Rubinisphaera sp.]|tara:strand:- start:6301 stop:7371 length:1071 start_codon:yes stop_codon:yes gene_type:complete
MKSVSLQHFNLTPGKGSNGISTGKSPLVMIISFSMALSFISVKTLHAQVPLGLPELKESKENPSTPGKIELGKMLFFDKRLSTDNTISCASCHDPAKGYSNGEQFATGVDNQKGGRNSPTVINSAFHNFQFWDGRAATLEEQALGPIQNPIEMNMKMDLALERINGIPEYRKRFEEEFGEPASDETLAKALAAFERTLLSGDAPYDRFEAGDKTALSEAAQRGKDLFFGKANCSACHSGGNFTDNSFHNIGIGMDQEKPDEGRFAISKLGGDTGAFKTPTLREIARTAPYMHDGSLKTLKEVVEHYNKGGIANEYLDEEIFEMNLTEQEMNDLVTFLKEGLSSESYPLVEAPELPE